MKNITRWLAAGALLTVVIAGITLTREHVEPNIAHALPAFSQTADTSIPDVVEKVLPSVVNISTTKVVEARGPAGADPLFNDPRSPFYGRQGRRYGNSLGSGVIVSTDGTVVTNSHVVAGASSISVSLADGREFDAELAGSDPQSDLAVLKLKSSNGNRLRNLEPIEIGKSSDMRLGETVLAIGNPFGVGQAVTMGIISAKGRTGMGIVHYEDFIQTDAAINPGNSGGALINTRGELIGINTAILSRSGGYQGIGFAIPTDMAKPIMKDLLDDGKVERGWLGVDIRTIDSEFAQDENLSNIKGVWIKTIMPESPASRSDLREGDIIVAMDGKEMSSAAQLSNAVALAGPGKTVSFGIVRNDSRRTIAVKLGDKAKARIPRDLERRERRQRRRR